MIQLVGLELETADQARNKRWCKYLDCAARGEPQALADLYDESSRLVFSIASRILGNSRDAEEVSLDVYTYIWRSAAQFDSSRASAPAWLIMLTRSRAIDRLRSIRSQSHHTGTDSNGSLSDTPVGSSNDAFSRLFVVSALQQLDSADRELLELVFYSGLSHSELATKLAAPLGTVKTRVRSALARLRKLAGEG